MLRAEAEEIDQLGHDQRLLVMYNDYDIINNERIGMEL